MLRPRTQSLGAGVAEVISEERGCDYAARLPQHYSAENLENIDEAPQPDFHFRCSHCIKLIGDDMPVYMHKDRSYCSTGCRTKGRSTLYRNLRDLQLEQSSKGRGTSSCESSCKDSRSGAGSGMSSAQSDSTLSSLWQRSRAGSEGAHGPLGWIVKNVVAAVVSRMPAPEMVRSASNVLRQRLMQDASFNRLTAYLPSAGSFTSWGDNNERIGTTPELSENSRLGSCQSLDGIQ